MAQLGFRFNWMILAYWPIPLWQKRSATMVHPQILDQCHAIFDPISTHPATCRTEKVWRLDSGLESTMIIVPLLKIQWFLCTSCSNFWFTTWSTVGLMGGYDYSYGFIYTPNITLWGLTEHTQLSCHHRWKVMAGAHAPPCPSCREDFGQTLAEESLPPRARCPTAA